MILVLALVALPFVGVLIDCVFAGARDSLLTASSGAADLGRVAILFFVVVFALGVLVGCAGDPDYQRVASQAACVVDGTPTSDNRSTVDLGSCTGVYIAPGVVLTAAHCSNLGWARAGGTVRASVLWVPHPNYVDGTRGHYFDLAVMYLDGELPLDVATLAHPSAGAAIVSGYGSGELAEAPVTVDAFYTRGRLSTLAGPDACYGDSGGPLYQGGALVGVVTAGLPGGGCGDGGLYTSPLFFVGWLTSEVAGVKVKAC